MNPKLRISETPKNDEPSEKMRTFPIYLNTVLHLASKYGKAEVVAYL
jgi:ankyrin repeat protein